MIDGIIFTPLPIINRKGGDVLHAMKLNSSGFHGFGEAYFSTIEHNSIKGWKLHKEMVLNLIVPIGKICFVIFDDRIESKTRGQSCKFVLSRENYGRLTVPSNLWVAFQGIDFNDSLLLNIANIPHDQNEVETRMLEEINYDWNYINEE